MPVSCLAYYFDPEDGGEVSFGYVKRNWRLYQQNCLHVNNVRHTFTRELWGSHGGNYEDYCVLECFGRTWCLHLHGKRVGDATPYILVDCYQRLERTWCFHLQGKRARDATPWILVDRYQRFGGTWDLHLQSRRITDATPCIIVDRYQRFGRTWSFHLQGRRARGCDALYSSRPLRTFRRNLRPPSSG
jgi:hypothetical protein